jgi:uncharacterized membrane protein YtjA (UPF0391 family)
MLSWSIFFLIVALVAAFLGFSTIAGTAAGIAKILFGVFLVLFLVSLVFGRSSQSSRCAETIEPHLVAAPGVEAPSVMKEINLDQLGYALSSEEHEQRSLKKSLVRIGFVMFNHSRRRSVNGRRMEPPGWLQPWRTIRPSRSRRS